MSKPRVFGVMSLLFSVFLLAACSSSGPATRYYSLFPAKSLSASAKVPADVAQTASVGIGPVLLPDFLENPSIIGLTNGTQVKVYSYHAWAGNLKESMIRVLAEDLSQQWQWDAVWGFPWDNRVRPDYQLRIVVDNFAGVRGGRVQLHFKWTLLNKKADKVLLMGKERLSAETGDDSVESYVSVMNQLINDASSVIAPKVSQYFTAR